MQFAEGIEERCFRQLAVRDSIRANDVESVTVVTKETELGIGQLNGEALVFLDGGQVAQVL